MKFIAAALFAAVATVTTAIPSENNLRGERELYRSDVGTFDEQLNVCKGAVCGLWGDPHVVTCDGLGYDCQGVGLFHLMNNHMFEIQAYFDDVGAESFQHIQDKGWDLPLGASLTNDVVIKNKETNEIIQIGFGDIDLHDDTYVSEVGCTSGYHHIPEQMTGASRIRVASTIECRAQCEAYTGCTQFTFYQDGGCYLNDDNAVQVKAPNEWSRTMTGHMNPDEENGACGVDGGLPAILDPDIDQMHANVNKNCPLYMYVDGVLQDLSGVVGDDVIYDNASTKVEIIKKLKTINYVYNKGDYNSVIQLNIKGKGPGERWSCHFDVAVCLPAEEAEQFQESTTGILGNPDGDKMNDWMTRPDEDGNSELIEVVMHGNDKHQMAFDYCYNNWCVDQKDSFFMPQAHQTWADVKCHDKPHRDFNETDPACDVNADKIREHCAGVPPLLRYGCELDCCMGDSCSPDEEDDDTPNVPDKFQEDNDKPQYDVPDHDDCIDGEFFKDGDSVCPNTDESIVTLVKSSGGLALPEDSTVIYGITVDVEPHGTVAGKTVKFRVNNPFDQAANIYVKHDKSVFTTFMDPVCDKDLSTAAGCDNTAPSVEAACHSYPGIDPFALVQVYYSSAFITPSDTEVDVCCEPEDGDADGVVMYTFEIKCTCPGTTDQ